MKKPPANPKPTAPSLEILGNAHVRQRLVDNHLRGRLHPCLVFEGPAGLGKKRSARWLAMRINCAEAGAPCGACWSCRQILADKHPEVLFIEPDPSKATAVITVEQARDLIGTMRLRPYHAKVRVVVFDPADSFTIEAANALLKTLEEPPEDTLFVLVTDRPNALLQTIRSRAQRVRFEKVPGSELATWLGQQGKPDPQWLAEMSEGCPGKALQLANGGAEQWRTARDRLLEVLAGELGGMFSRAETMAKGGRAEASGELALVLDAIERLLQDALAMAVSGWKPRFHADRTEVVAAWSQALGLPGIERVEALVRTTRRELEAHVSARLLLDALFTSLAGELGPARMAGRAPNP